MKKLKKIKEKIKTVFFRKKSVKVIDLASDRDVDDIAINLRDVPYAWTESRLSNPKEDDELEAFTDYSEIGS